MSVGIEWDSVIGNEELTVALVISRRFHIAVMGGQTRIHRVGLELRTLSPKTWRLDWACQPTS